MNSSKDDWPIASPHSDLRARVSAPPERAGLRSPIILKSLAALLLLLDLNSATVRQLDTLPGIGPVLAGRIVEFRTLRGGFRRVEELLAIPGISERRWRALRDRIEVPTPVDRNSGGR